MSATVPAAEQKPLEVYLRLFGYARPSWRMFLLGVLGMALSPPVEPAVCCSTIVPSTSSATTWIC